MNQMLAGLALLVSVLVMLAGGILVSYGAVTAVLQLFAPHPSPARLAPAVLANRSQSGD